MRLLKQLAFAALLALSIVGVADPAHATQSTTIAVTVTGTYSATVGGFSTTLPLSYGKSFALANGTGADQAQTVFAVQNVNIAASGSTTYDISGGVTDYTGATINLTKVRAILVYAYPGNTNTVNVFGAGANAFVGCVGSTTDVVKVNPGSLLLLTARDSNGCTVTAGTGDLLKIANGGAGTGVNFDLIVVGI